MKAPFLASLLVGGLFAAPLAYMLMAQYAAEVPADPQKGIGYIIIGLYCCFVWMMTALLVRGVIKAFSDDKASAKSFLFSAAGGLAIAAFIFYKQQLSHIQIRFLETTDKAEALHLKAKAALTRNNIMALKAIARNPHAPSAVLAEIATFDDSQVLQALAANPRSPQALLKELSKTDRYLIKMSLLDNPALGGDVLKGMLSDDDARIRKAARVKIEQCEALVAPSSS